MILRWLHKHGFTVDKTTSQYVDGHDRPDVVEYRQAYLQRKLDYDRRIISHVPTQDEIEHFMTLPLNERPIIYVSQDEMTCWANDRKITEWRDEASKSKPCRQKSFGSSIMVSGWFDSISGGCANQGYDWGFTTTECDKDGWWTSDRMKADTQRVIKILESAYPWAQFLFLFDWSSNHSAKSAGVPCLDQMNKNEAGSQQIYLPQTVPTPSGNQTYEYHFCDPKNVRKLIPSFHPSRDVQ